MASIGKPVDPYVEGVAYRHVFVELRAGRLGET
jgi:hypothetical protein